MAAKTRELLLLLSLVAGLALTACGGGGAATKSNGSLGKNWTVTAVTTAGANKIKDRLGVELK